jgi:hypothetical protein
MDLAPLPPRVHSTQAFGLRILPRCNRTLHQIARVNTRPLDTTKQDIFTSFMQKSSESDNT